MPSEPYGPNAIEVDGTAMLLTTTGGGVAVHLTAQTHATEGREAVPDFYFDMSADSDAIGRYDRTTLTNPRWSETTLCGRRWAVMVGGDGGPIGPYGGVAFAPSCRRCLNLMDRHFPKPTTDSRLAAVARLGSFA